VLVNQHLPVFIASLALIRRQVFGVQDRAGRKLERPWQRLAARPATSAARAALTLPPLEADGRPCGVGGTQGSRAPAPAARSAPLAGLRGQQPPLGTPPLRWRWLRACGAACNLASRGSGPAGGRSQKAGVPDLPDISKRGLGPRRTWSRMPEHPNGTPGKKPRAPSVKRRPVRSFSSMVEILKTRLAPHADDAKPPRRTPKKKRRGDA
jgi:hypothetical protein